MRNASGKSQLSFIVLLDLCFLLFLWNIHCMSLKFRLYGPSFLSTFDLSIFYRSPVYLLKSDTSTATLICWFAHAVKYQQSSEVRCTYYPMGLRVWPTSRLQVSQALECRCFRVDRQKWWRFSVDTVSYSFISRIEIIGRRESPH